jgi:hypothetical protein
MENPWAELPQTPPFVAPADKSLIDRHPERAPNLQLNFLPSPFHGTPDARVYVLQLNPGAGHDDFKYGADFVEERRRALRFESSSCFWPLNAALRGTPAHDYSTKKMRLLIEEVGEDCVAGRMMWVEYFGYQSLKYRDFPVVLPSQRFAFQLVREAIAARKTVIIARSRRLWLDAVPELARYDYIELRNPRNPTLTPNNMGPAELGLAKFSRVVEALRC